MKLLFGKSRKESEAISQKEDKIVLFVCVENTGRSQIAEAFFRKYAPRGYMTVSGGTRPAGEINPVVVQAMKEIGMDISKQKSRVCNSFPRKLLELQVQRICDLYLQKI